MKKWFRKIKASIKEVNKIFVEYFIKKNFETQVPRYSIQIAIATLFICTFNFTILTTGLRFWIALVLTFIFCILLTLYTLMNNDREKIKIIMLSLDKKNGGKK
jgi:hypothetical protein